MDLYLFHNDEFSRHYNCALKTDAGWAAEGQPNYVIGGFCIAVGLAYLFLYIPCLMVMRGKELIGNSCYKLMFGL
uniref:TM2 domain-containing protein n=1 Tax=Steinernema glaseri TaxID=37863 RepID=A0A1I8AHW9_9BILA